MLKCVCKLYRVYSLKHFKLCNIQKDSRFYFSSYREDNKYLKDEKLTEKDLTPVTLKDKWDAPEITSVGNIVHTLRLSQFSRRHDVDFYLRLVKRAAKEGDTEKMISVLFHDMLIRDRVLPDRHFINILLFKLSNLGGHSEAAFRILKKMIEIRVEPNMVTYSLVFKNCAREISEHKLYFNICDKGVSLLSPEELEQLQVPAKRAFHIWKSITDKGEDFVLSTTNSLLLALNRASMLKESCIVLDRFIEQGNLCDDYTLSAILEGCLTDQRSGFGLALAFYNKLFNHCKLHTSPYVITTLLKVATKCQFGSPSLIDKVLNSSSGPSQPFLEVFQSATESTELVPVERTSVHSCPQLYNSNIKETAQSYGLDLDEFIESNWCPSSELIYLLKSPTNMLQKKFYNHFNPKWLQTNLTPASKLVCLGGIFGIINIIKQASILPNITTLTSLIACLPHKATVHPMFPSEDLFIVVLEKMAKHLQIHQDQAFKNAILKRQTILGLKPHPESVDISKFDPYTWSVHAKNCKNVSDLKVFFDLLSHNGIVADQNIMLSLMTSVYTWGSRLFLLNKMQQFAIVPGREMIVLLENEIFKMRKRIDTISDDEQGRKMKELFYNFQNKYAAWIDNIEVDRVNTGKRKIFVDDIPEEYKQR